MNVLKTIITRSFIFWLGLVSGLELAICLAVAYRYHQAAGIIHIWAGAIFIGWVVFVRFGLAR